MKIVNIILALFLMSLSVTADEPGLIIKTKMKTDVMGIGGTIINTVQYHTTAKSREESYSSAFGINVMFENLRLDTASITIRDLNENFAYQLDPTESRYVVIRFDSIGAMIDRYSSDDQYDIFVTDKQARVRDQLEEIIWITTVDSTDTLELYNGFPCRKYIYTTCEEGDSTGSEYVSEIWFHYDEAIAPIISNYYSRINDNSIFQASLNSVGSNPLIEPMMEHYQMTFAKIASEGVYPIYNRYEMKFPRPDIDTLSSPEEIEKQVNSLYGDDSVMADMVKSGAFKFLQLMTEQSDDNYACMLKITTETTEIISAALNDSLFMIPDYYEEVGAYE